MKTISKRLEEIREKLNLSKVQMANELKISKQIYQNLENGERRLQIEELKILMEKFNINPIWIISDEEDMYIESDPKKVSLTNMIIDFRNYGCEIDIVINEIIKKILEKLFQKKKVLKVFWTRPHSKYKDHVIYSLMHILMDSNFIDTQENSKNYFRDQIELFDKAGGPSPTEVKKTLYTMLENLNWKDCFYLLKHKKIASQQLLTKISPMSKKLNHVLIKKDRKIHQRIENIK